MASKRVAAFASMTDRQRHSFWSRVHKTSSCWEWTGRLCPKGYGMFTVRNQCISAHRLSYIMHHGQALVAKQYVCHHCDNRRCVNPAHLYLGSHDDNMRDMRERGRAYRWNGKRCGTGNPASRLTEAMVIEIRASREHSQALADKYGVTLTTVYNARNGITWKHLPGVAMFHGGQWIPPHDL